MYNRFTLLPPEIIDYIWFLVHKTYTNNLKMTNAVLIRHKRLLSSSSFSFDRTIFRIFPDGRLSSSPLFKPVTFGKNLVDSVIYDECYRDAGYYYQTPMSNWCHESGVRKIPERLTYYGRYGTGAKYLRLWDDPSSKFVCSLQSIQFCEKKVLLYEKLAECLELSVDELRKIPKYKYTKNTKIQIIKHIMAL